MKNIHVLPTEKPSRLYLDRGKFWIDNLVYGSGNQYIYITSDEEFVRDEYVTDGIEVIKASPKLVNAQSLIDRRDWKKIILTTDQDLIKDGVQAIDDEFLEWFVKNPSCESVDVRKETYAEYKKNSYNDIYLYEIIIPQEKPKQETLENLKNQLKKVIKEHPIDVNEDTYWRGVKIGLETAIEVLKLHKAEINQAKEMEKQQIIDADLNAYINGSRAQAKLMYSEEEVIELLKTFDKNFNSGIVERNKGINEWFEQFKNK